MVFAIVMGLLLGGGVVLLFRRVRARYRVREELHERLLSSTQVRYHAAMATSVAFIPFLSSDRVDFLPFSFLSVLSLSLKSVRILVLSSFAYPPIDPP